MGNHIGPWFPSLWRRLFPNSDSALEYELSESVLRQRRQPVSGAKLIAAERERQVAAERWTSEHDDGEHDSGELVYAAISYAYSPFSDVRVAPDGDHRKYPGTAVPATWPWEPEWWKPTPCDRIRELTKAGALIAAEIDRLQRRDGNSHDSPGSAVARIHPCLCEGEHVCHDAGESHSQKKPS